jgi:AAA15 family ATPase/GTPase
LWVKKAMLIQFTIQNYKTFKEEAKLTMYASNYDKTTREEENIHPEPDYNLRLLKSAVIYGANASGKSKLIDALQTMQKMVVGIKKEGQETVEPFLLNTETENEPSVFEVIFIENKEEFRYGFEVKKKQICSEWLYYKPKTKEIELFLRNEQNFEIHPIKFKKGNLVAKEGLVREDTLLLTVATRFNDVISKRVTEWFNNMSIGINWDENKLTESSISRTSEREDIKEKVLALLQTADIGIEGILPRIKSKEHLKYYETSMVSESYTPYYGRNIENTRPQNSVDTTDVITEHKKYDANKQQVGSISFSLLFNESEGTKKYFAYTVPIIEALERGSLLVIDELDAKLHPNLVQKIVEIFNSKTQNPLNAQLIFNTHDTNLLRTGLFRRDQIWFVEKDRYGAAALYSLASFKTDEGGRKNDAFEEKYLTGRYGGVPIFGDFNSLNLALKEEIA